MDLAFRDTQIEHILRIIAEKKEEQFAKLLDLQKSKQENPMLECIVEDYKTDMDNSCIKKQKIYDSLYNLSDFLDNKVLDKDDSLLNEIKYDQKQILKEMSKIKKEINDIKQKIIM